MTESEDNEPEAPDESPDTPQVADIAEALQRAMTSIVEVMQPIMQTVVTLWGNIYSTLHNTYLEQGAIYGDSEEGMMRWLKECGEAARHRMEAERIEQYHAGMRAFKEQLERRQEE